MPPKPITVVHNFGGRRNTGTPLAVQEWGLWDCDPTKTGPPSRRHAYGKEFPWLFDKLEKAYVLEGEATLTPDDTSLHGKAVRIGPKDMVTFPKGWKGRWEVHSFFKKHYAFFDGKGLRVDEASDSEEEEEEEPAEAAGAKQAAGGKPSPAGKGRGRAASAAETGSKDKVAKGKAARTKGSGGAVSAAKKRKL